MALRRNLAKRLIHLSAPRATASSPVFPPYADRSVSSRNYLASPDVASRGFFRRFLQRRAIYQYSSPKSTVRLPKFLTLPAGDKLREKLWETSVGGEYRMRPAREAVAGSDSGAVTVDDARRIVRAAQVEKVKQRLRAVAESTISYSEFFQICADVCGSEDQGLEFAKLLDDSATVIVWGNVVFIRPEQVAKSMEILISQSIAKPNDPRRKELGEMEKQKAKIDDRARTLVRRELYGGLGLLVAQTVAFMRLTFWELSWDVMEPICFFGTSVHLAFAFAFFLRTSTEPSFEGYFRQRFRTKQAKLMKIHSFDFDKYQRLSKAFYPYTTNNCHCHDYVLFWASEKPMIIEVEAHKRGRAQKLLLHMGKKFV